MSTSVTTGKSTIAAPHLLSYPRLLRNVSWNLIGGLLPLGIAAWAIPHLVVRLGADRFGLLTLIWALVGYFGLFDLGFGRALTKLVAERLGGGRHLEVFALTTTALKTLGVIGLVVGGCLAAAAPWFVGSVLSVPPGMQRDAVVSLAITALTLPAVMSTNALIGVLQAHQRFGQLAVVQIALGAATFIGPVVALQVSPTLSAVAVALAVSRALAWVVYRQLCRSVVPGDSRSDDHTRSLLPELFRFGGWVTVSNVIGPLMVYSDRFVIAAIVTVGIVAYYTTPYEMITRLWIVADGLVAVMFPAVTTAIAAGGSEARTLFTRSTRMMTIWMLLPTGLTVVFAREILTLWLGPTFGDMSASVLRWLAVGVFINAVARLPFAAVQASGRPDLTARLHLVEFPLYVCAVWLLVRRFGIVGAAAAWTLRIGVDAAALFVFAFRHVPGVIAARSNVLLYLAFAVALLLVMALPAAEWLKAAEAAALVLLVGSVGLLDLRVALTARQSVSAS